MPPATQKVNWKEERPILSTKRVAQLLGVSWPIACHLMERGDIASINIQRKGQRQWRCSPHALKTYLTAVNRPRKRKHG